MNCVDFVELVTEFLEGALPEADERRFIEHLAECSGCESYLDQFRQTIATTGELTPDNISPDARQQLLSAFRGWHRQ
ncbi:zf-HC2 domain-containing protein [Streptomyces sp. NBC_01619]|uniref:Zf-HC2 domain-containing protein n=1 Tax=Streptomyces pratisoli TaxID=3139917 RepID=A0ACC6QS28_9ACTN|nr:MULTISPECIES: zf-HC2 domain-containing protein [unclassified Streptomyces]MCX4514357.1 zf-HC2 domain-containing protein [Streptomyces sp. NBC_01619]